MTANLLLLDGVHPIGSKVDGEYLIVLAEADVPAPERCPQCGHKPLYKHGRRTYQYADTNMGGKHVKVEIERQRYRCTGCGKIETPAIPSLDEKRIATKRLIRYIESKCFSRTFTALAEDTGLAVNTIKSIALDFMARLDEVYVRETPRIMGVDEVKICGSYCAVITNLEMRTTFDILQKRTKDVITPYFRNLKDKDKVEWIALDMWGPYKDVLSQELPSARMVIDRYHVVEKASRALDAIRIKLQGNMEKGSRVKMKKHLRWALLRRNGNRTPEDEQKLAYIRENHPKLAKAFEIAEAFHDIYEIDDRADAEAAFELWSNSIPPEFDDTFGNVARMVNKHYENVFNYFDLKITNAFTEAENGLVKLANRMGRGYSFEITRGRYLYSKVASQIGQVIYHEGTPTSITDPSAVWGRVLSKDYGRYVGYTEDE